MRGPYLAEELGAEIPGGGAPVPDQSPILADGGLMDWRTSLPENLRKAGVIQQHPTMEGAAKTLVSQADMLGRALFLPNDAPDTPAYQEKMQAIYTKLGRPASAEAYTSPEMEGYALDADETKTFRAEAHAAGLTQAQVDKLMAYDAGRLKRAGNQLAAQAAQSEITGRQRLQAEFGASTEATIAQARGFFEHFGAGAYGGEAGKAAWQEILDAKLPDGSLLKNSPHLIAAFAEAGKSIGEGEWYDSSHYTPGQNTAEVLSARKTALTAKRHDGTITETESTELRQVFTQLAAQQDRQNRQPTSRRSG